GFGLALGAMAFMFAVEIATYLIIRSQRVGLADLKDEIIDGLKSLLPGASKKSTIKEVAGQVVLIGADGKHVETPANEDPWRTSYDIVQTFFIEPMNKEAQTVDVTATGTSAGVKYWVDGVAYDGASYDRQSVADALAYLKNSAGLDPEERRKPQFGKMKVLRDGTRHEVRVQTAGTRDGEIAKLEIDVPKRYQMKPADVGFTADQLQLLVSTANEPGIVLIASPKNHGLTALQYAMIRLHDAFVSHILTVERDPPIEIEGITQNKLSPSAPPAEEAKTTAWVTSQEPDVLLMGGLETPQAARSLIDLAANGKRIYVGLRAGDVFEALEVWKKVVGDNKLAVSQVKFVIAGRIFRRLCDATKAPYQPEEKLLKQLGFGPTQVPELYRPHFGNLIDARGNEIPDTFCHGLGYKGRFGVYELLEMNDEVKQAVATNQSTSVLRQLFRKQKRRYIQELALMRVAAGDTSVQEFLRVMKPGSELESEINREPPSSKAG
ncbi:MAG TPA: ATPase, T2SS/T4P/T4SS family, partial [Tepidisphaeraceae bacterium]|nr:ATPase, T2SS/T4P/T4SS family [Tepidisphaeraceae bacterium]